MANVSKFIMCKTVRFFLEHPVHYIHWYIVNTSHSSHQWHSNTATGFVSVFSRLISGDV